MQAVQWHTAPTSGPPVPLHAMPTSLRPYLWRARQIIAREEAIAATPKKERANFKRNNPIPPEVDVETW